MCIPIRLGVIFFAFFSFLSFFLGLAHAEPCPESHCSEYLVKFSHKASESQIDAILQQESLWIVHYFETGRIYHLDGDRERPQDEILKELNDDPDVVYAEPNYSLQANFIPNDPRFPDLWALQNTGQYQGTLGVDIGVQSVWDELTAETPVVVAILDSGIDYRHEDLAANMWVNRGEIPNNRIDDDGNGYVDDVYGYNFVADTGDPSDDYFHGTHVAGIIGAVGNNGIGVTGIAGINGHVQLMALKFMGANGQGALSDAIQGINYAVQNGAKVINNSWDFTYPGLTSLPSSPSLEPVQSLRDAIVASDQAGVIFVSAAGNTGNNNDLSPNYPSSYSVGNILSVAAIDNKNALPLFSNYGNTTVDLGAPGVLIESTYPTWKENPPYHFLSGTSMASPQVAGAIALLWSENANLTHRQIRDLILQGVDSVPDLSGKSVTGGRLDIAQSFALGLPNVNHPPVANAGSLQQRTVGDTVLLQGTATDADGDVPLTFQWTLTSPSNEMVSFTGPQITFVAGLVGTYSATLIVSDGKSSSVPATSKIYVTAPVSTNHPPVASAGPNQLRHIGDTVLLRGNGTDLDGDPLTYQWTLTLPAGSHASLVSSTSATTSFVADVIGTYSTTLVVKDGKTSSLSVTAKIFVTTPTTVNHPPVASAGPNQLRHVGDTVLLRGSGTDLDGDPLTYQWALIVPAGSHALLLSPTSAIASFEADVIGAYSATLTVHDGKISSPPVTAKIFVAAALAVTSPIEKTALSSPSAQDAPTLVVLIEAQKEGSMIPLDPALGGKIVLGETLLLDGSGSSIVSTAASTTQNESLEYEWTLIEKPMGSSGLIQQSDQSIASLTPDKEGRYTIQLEISAGKFSTRGEAAFLALAESPSTQENSGAENSGQSPAETAPGGCSLLMMPMN